MIFTKDSIDKIRAGRKWETRRIWKKPHVKVGGVYRTRSSRFAKCDPDAPTIRVLEVRREKLADHVSYNKAVAEGFNTLGEFVEVWRKLHGRWNPFQWVYVVRFEVVDP